MNNRKGGGLSGLAISVIWVLVALGVLLAIYQSTGSLSMDNIIGDAREKAQHYSECVPKGECGPMKMIENIRAPEGSDLVIDSNTGESLKIGGSTTPPERTGNNEVSYEENHVEKDTRGYRGPSKGEPFVLDAGKTNKETSENILEMLGIIDKEDKEDIEFTKADWKHWKTSGNWSIKMDVLDRDAKPDTVTYLNKKKELVNNQEDAIIIGKILEEDDEISISTDDVGEWIDPYSGKKIRNTSDLEVDHIVSLEYANEHGGHSWDNEKKERFANDKENLLTVSAKEYDNKNKTGPNKYMPKNRNYHCQYAKSFIGIIYKYELNIGENDQEKLNKTLEGCSV